MGVNDVDTIRRGSCLMMMFDYKGGRGGGQESGKR